MTVPISDRLSQLYVGNGTNTRFDFTFRVFNQEDATGIAIRKKGKTEFETVDPSEYTVTLNQDGFGGYVSFNIAPSSTDYFYIAGATPLDQLLDITNYDNFYPDAIERALDKLTALLQEWGTQLDQEKQARILADIQYDSLAMEREENLEHRLISYINAVVGITNPAIFEGISDRMIITEDGRTQREFNASIPFWTDDYVNFKQETYLREEKILEHADQEIGNINNTLGPAIDNERLRAMAAEDALDNRINALGGGMYGFNTYAAFDAVKATIPANSVVNIAEPNNTGTGEWAQGDNIWDGTTLKKSPYDPLELAKTFATNKANTAEENANQHTDKLIGQNFAKGKYPLVSDEIKQSSLWVDGGYIGLTLFEALTLLRIKNQLGLKGLTSKRFVPFHEDLNRDCGAWLEDGLFRCAGVHPATVKMIKDQLGPISGSITDNVTGAAYPIVSDSASLRQWKAKVATLKKGSDQQLRVLLTGDSWTEHNTITNELLAMLRAEYGESGSGWVNLGTENNQLDGISVLFSSGWNYADLNQVSGFPNGSGPDGFTRTSSVAGSTITVNNLTKGDSLSVFFGKTDGTFKYSVNGGAETIVNASSTGAAVQSTVIPISGASNIVFTIVSGTVVFFGMHLRKTTGSGVEVTKLGNGGSTGQDYLKISPTAQANFANYLKPDVVVIILGTNDYRYGHSVANFKAGISAIIDGYRTNNAECGIILIAPAQSNAPAVIPLSEYRDAIYELAQTKKAEFYNMYDDWNTYAAENNNGQWADAYHVSSKGAYRVAKKMFNNFLEI